MALPAQKTTALEARLAAMALPEGGWTDAARKEALTRVQTMGLPDRRDEYWRYTRPDTLVQAAPVEMGLDTSDEPGFFAALNPCRLVFVDGVFDADGSDLDALPASVSIERLADQNSDLHWARDIFGVLESAGQAPVERPLAALNTAFASDGILVHVTGKADRPIHIVYQNTDTQSDVMLHHVVKVDAEAEVTLLESGPTGARTNMVMEVSVADTGAFHHVRVQGREQERQSATHIFGRLGTESTFKSFTL
ncbi:MAG: Fe-S cluster assembly protein SufD, partial [Rhodobacteraceae bacterium]|nr:Fe-S cluster assembly protein SufD [Paracoccaceae bacterium]